MPTVASGIGSWPGTSPREAVRVVRDMLADGHLPFLPELPGRGPGADLIGRTAALLPGLAVDLQPSGWRLTDAPGRDARRATAYLREDLDEVAEAYDGWSGRFKVQLTGPWTLAATLALPRGERMLSDHGATRDLTQSLAEAARDQLARVRALVPGIEPVLQLDESGLPGVLAGSIPTASGYGRLRAADPGVVRDGLRAIVDAVGAPVVVHSCAPDVPVRLLTEAGADVSLDTALAGDRQWDEIAGLLESGRTLYAGLLPTDRLDARPDAITEPLLGRFDRLGLEPDRFAQVVVTPACGLAGATEQAARTALRTAGEAAGILAERATD
ncbi:methionine synthase [Calidifontibacter sp. DB0510]|uniref:Methionine synthase n=1 Tax=Metallococcus carri TaxID=1656884 RepID=A0A967B4X9_9MICO|nr:methionine synthase [Metallococcus carri]NHN55707.1 methionine synthase [Metallococcus carri]NOP38604.1 methionine synthase [Calidifontibacter sp. DB2511S]